MKKSPLVSIITPCYNAGAYLSATINSVLAQTYMEWEWLIVDDCSKDNSYEILVEASLRDKRLRVLKNSSNQGAYAARNHGLVHAKGIYIAFIDADDLWHPEKLSRQIAFMELNGYHFTYTGFTRFKGVPNSTDKAIKVPHQTSYTRLLKNTVIATSTVVVNKERLGAFQMENVYYDDFILWLDLLKRTPYAYGLNESLTRYRISDHSLSRNKATSAKKVYEIFVNYLNLGVIRSRIYFCCWAVNAVLRYMRY